MESDAPPPYELHPQPTPATSPQPSPLAPRRGTFRSMFSLRRPRQTTPTQSLPTNHVHPPRSAPLTRNHSTPNSSPVHPNPGPSTGPQRQQQQSAPLPTTQPTQPQHVPRRTASSAPDSARAARIKTAQETLAAITAGAYTSRDVAYNLRRRVRAMKEGTQFYGEDDLAKAGEAERRVERTFIEVLNITTLDAARLADKATNTATGPEDQRHQDGAYGDDETSRDNSDDNERPRIGILTSASPHIPGGDFRIGDDGQELSISRASTLSAALESRAARQFYRVSDTRSPGNWSKMSADAAYHTHAMIYTPGVTVFRDEAGKWMPPLDVDVITCTAVHAGDVRAASKGAKVEARIQSVTHERLKRVLSLFAQRSVHTLVLPAFGAGTFQNDITSIAKIYASLLLVPQAPFAGVFDRVVFAIMPESRWREFKDAFWAERRRGALSKVPAELHEKKQRPKVEDGGGDIHPHTDIPRSGHSVQDGSVTAVVAAKRGEINLLRTYIGGKS